jgi:general secretion pathway protein M
MRGMALTREQLAGLGALVALLLGCVLIIGYSVSLRSEAAEELAERRELLSRLARAPARRDASAAAQIVEAPPSAYIEAPTHGQAGAQLQSYFARIATEQSATVGLSGVEALTREAPDEVLVQATLEISLGALQALLYQLETGTPYVTVGSLSVRPSSPAMQRTMPEGPLRVSLTLRGLWRRGAA